MSIHPTPDQSSDPFFPEEVTEEGFPQDDSLEEELGDEEYISSLEEPDFAMDEWSETSPSLDSRQERLLKWLDRHDDEFQKTIENVQTRYENLLEGGPNLSTADRLEKVKAVETLLEDLDEDMMLYEQRESLLVRSGLSKDWVRSQSEGPPAAEEIKDIEKNLKQLKQELNAVAQQESEAEAQEIEKQALSQQARGLIDYVTGANDKNIYFSAEADGRNVKEVSRKEGDPVEMIFTHIADALKADNEQGWSTLDQYLRGLIGNHGQTVAVMATTIIQDNLPQLWEQLPATTLRELAKGMTTGDHMDIQRVRRYEGSIRDFLRDSHWVNTRVSKNRGRNMSFENGMNPKQAFDFLTDLAIRKEKDAESEADQEAATESGIEWSEMEEETIPETEAEFEEFPEAELA